MLTTLQSAMVARGNRIENALIAPNDVHGLSNLLCSWGLGDQQATVFCSWVRAAAVEYRANCQVANAAENGMPASNVVDIFGQAALQTKLEQSYADLGEELHAESCAKTCLDRCATAEDRRNAGYAVGVMRTFALATGLDPLNPSSEAERHLAHAFLWASLNLVTPMATPAMVSNLYSLAFDFSSAPRQPH